MTVPTLRNTAEATWDEQGCTPVPVALESVLHAHNRAPHRTPGDTPADGRFTCSRVKA